MADLEDHGWVCPVKHTSNRFFLIFSAWSHVFTDVYVSLIYFRGHQEGKDTHWFNRWALSSCHTVWVACHCSFLQKKMRSRGREVSLICWHVWIFVLIFLRNIASQDTSNLPRKANPQDYLGNGNVDLHSVCFLFCKSVTGGVGNQEMFSINLNWVKLNREV